MNIETILSRVTVGPNWPILWHPKLGKAHLLDISPIAGTATAVFPNGHHCPVDNDFKIIAKSFQTLCEEVKNSPTDNAALVALNSCYPNSPWQDSCITDDGEIGILYAGDILVTISNKWQIEGARVGKSFFDILISEGYAVGFAPDERIEESQIPKQ